MTYRLNAKEFEAVQRLSVRKRYAYLVKRAADWGELWALRSSDGWVVGADEDGREFVPVWPHPRFAESQSNAAWADASPEPIEVHRWIHEWTSELIADGRLVGVFPVDGQENAVIEPSEFRADLGDELALIE
jgi:hypothetical protein